MIRIFVSQSSTPPLGGSPLSHEYEARRYFFTRPSTHGHLCSRWPEFLLLLWEFVSGSPVYKPGIFNHALLPEYLCSVFAGSECRGEESFGNLMPTSETANLRPTNLAHCLELFQNANMTLRIKEPTKRRSTSSTKRDTVTHKTCSAGGPLSEPAAPTLSLPYDENGCAQRPLLSGIL